MKDFKEWHNKKSSIDRVEEKPFFHEKEIWGCHLGLNIGFEQDGKGNDFMRPVVIVRKFNNHIFWGIPLTKSIKRESPYYFNFSFINNELSSAIVSQIRLSHLLGYMSQNDFLELNKKLKALLP